MLIGIDPKVDYAFKFMAGKETTKSILDIIEKSKPVRIVFDSLSELRLLAQSPLRYRRQILWLKQFFVGRNCTVVLLDDRSAKEGEDHLQSLAWRAAFGTAGRERAAERFSLERMLSAYARLCL